MKIDSVGAALADMKTRCSIAALGSNMFGTYCDISTFDILCDLHPIAEHFRLTAMSRDLLMEAWDPTRWPVCSQY